MDLDRVTNVDLWGEYLSLHSDDFNLESAGGGGEDSTSCDYCRQVPVAPWSKFLCETCDTYYKDEWIAQLHEDSDDEMDSYDDDGYF